MTNGNLGREQGMHESTTMIQHGSSADEAMEVMESRVLGWATSFHMMQRVRLEVRKFFLNPIH